MGRGLAFGRTAWPGVGEVLLGSTHLESFVGEEQRQQVLSSRQAQLREAASLLEREARRHGCVAAVLIGDMNWNDEDGDPLRAPPPLSPTASLCSRCTTSSLRASFFIRRRAGRRLGGCVGGGGPAQGRLHDDVEVPARPLLRALARQPRRWADTG
jgi:hypothetical protein